MSNQNFLSKKHQFLVLLKLCSSIKHLSQIQAQIVISNLHQDSFLLTELVRFSSISPFRNLTYAHSLLLNSLNSTPSTWNILIRGHASSNSPQKAIWLLKEMRKRGFKRNKLTYPFVLKACAGAEALEEGRQVHGEIVKHGLDDDVYVDNNLVYFYGCCEKIMYAKKVFDEMGDRTIVSWNAMISAFVENFCIEDALGYFVKMRDCGFDPDETTMVIMLSACAELGFLSLGWLLHLQVIERGLVLNCQLGTALVDMYAKSGDVRYASRVFERMEEKNVWTWSAMILGFAQHGFAKEALELFVMMTKSSCIRPNYVTFLGVLCACSHAGLVDDGYRYFREMEYVHGIKPMMVHYGAMVDVLGRAGCLKDAYTFIKNMPFEPDPILWRTLLSACTVCNVNDTDGVGEKVRKRLLELEPRRSGNLVMISNMYAEAGKWDRAANVRRFMRDRGLKIRAGESCLELNGSIYQFFSGYDSQFDFDDIYPLLHTLTLHMKMTNLL
ncbi:pentatricopeptide repeat-containing protein At2g36730 [Durio zibethinus]|uniref:Pentatricopeptide repeat-containing protein At2g36730 n=1 Tax=Durio zibethinus TaxID=66656 RepID=A0A6P5YIU4_DURZI|nr:pentatricopeptide repeat-containing protein At2g36730 [Durio zibethinus]